jgi:hypothetical protein
MTQGISGYVKIFYLINCISYTAVQRNDTDFTKQVVFVKRKNNLKYTELCSMMYVFVCVPATKHGNVVLGQGLREIFVLKGAGVAGERTKLHSEELHDLYWACECLWVVK